MMANKRRLIGLGCVGLYVVVAIAVTPGRGAEPAATAPATAAPAGQAPNDEMTPANRALMADVLKVFKDTCAECHSPDGKRKKFTYILNLHELRANKEYITIGNPAKSLLYQQLVDDEMPPPKTHESLKPAEKEAVRKWIAAGCPVPPPPPPRSFMARAIEFLGYLHPVAAHTPIAMLMAAAIAEMLYFRHPAPALAGAARFCVVLGALGAVPTAAFGWAWATSPDFATTSLDVHRWTGTAAAIASIPLAVIGEWGARRAHRDGRKWHGPSRWIFRIAVFAIAGLVGFTAHLGGILVHPKVFVWPAQ